MDYYKLRVDVFEDLQKYRDLESKYFNSYVRAKEGGSDGSNVHYHYYFSSTVRKETIRQYIQKYIGKGNGIYSLKLLREEKPLEYLSYLIKEDTNTVWFNMADGVRDEVMAYDKEMKDKVKASKTKTMDRVQKIQEFYVSKYGSLSRLNREQLVEAVVEYHQVNKLVIRFYQIEGLITTILVNNEEAYKAQFCRSLLNKINYDR